MIYQKLHTIDHIHFFKYDDGDNKLNLLDAIVEPSKYIIHKSNVGYIEYVEYVYLRFDKIKEIKSEKYKLTIYLLDDDGDDEYNIFNERDNDDNIIDNILNINQQIRNLKLKELLDLDS